MVLELSKENIEKVKDAIEAGNDSFLVEAFTELHAADITEFIERLSTNDGRYLLRLLPEQLAAEVLIELEEDDREKLISSYTTKEIAEIIDNIDSDDAADVLSELSDTKKEEVISLLDDAEQASDIIDLLNYAEGTAGSLMAKEMVKVNVNWTVTQAIREMRKQAEDVEHVYTIYVVDDEEKLVGTLSLKKLLFNTSLRSTISEIYYSEKVRFAEVQQPAEEIVEIMNKYDLVVLPVVDENFHLMGRITIDDAVDVMQEESERDYQLASGLSGNVESDDKFWVISRARLPWLLIGLLGGVVTAKVIGLYEADLQIIPQLAYFVPLIAAMGGNAGVQSSAIVVQGLASSSLSFDGVLPRLLKELMVSVLNALVCSLLLLGFIYLLGSTIELALTVSISLISVIIVASLLGTFIPLFLDKFNIDPALATGPFITTTNDIIGLTIYFTVGHLMYGL